MDGREGQEGVQRIVDAGKAAVGFVLSAVPTAQIMRVADAGQLLPAKVRRQYKHILVHIYIYSYIYTYVYMHAWSDDLVVHSC